MAFELLREPWDEAFAQMQKHTDDLIYPNEVITSSERLRHAYNTGLYFLILKKQKTSKRLEVKPLREEAEQLWISLSRAEVNEFSPKEFLKVLLVSNIGFSHGFNEDKTEEWMDAYVSFPKVKTTKETVELLSHIYEIEYDENSKHYVFLCRRILSNRYRYSSRENDLAYRVRYWLIKDYRALVKEHRNINLPPIVKLWFNYLKTYI